MICAASYEARAFGVRAATSVHVARARCPNLILIPPRHDRYSDVSREVMEVLGGWSPIVEQVSVDEAYLEATRLFGSAAADPDTALEAALPFARELKERIRSERGLTASIGVASNKLLAKLGSDFKKPDGLTVIRDADRVAFLRPLPCRALHGVGQVTNELLAKAGLHTIADLQDHPGDLRALTGSFGPTLKQFAFGIDDRPLELGDDIKSISSENTFPRDTADRPTLRRCLREQADEIAAKLQRRRLAARTVQVKVRYGDFSTLTRQVSVEDPVTDPRDLYRLGCWLLARENLVHRPLRLLGLGASGLLEVRCIQLPLPFPKAAAEARPT